MRSLIILGLISVALFLLWFFREPRMGHPFLFWLLCFAWFFKLLRTLHEWYHYFSIGIPESPVLTKRYTVDIFTTACPGEPLEMIVNTLKAMQNITYPHTSYLCDEGGDPFLKKTCEELGVIHVTRKEKTDAKAGNINNALRQAKGDICIILDPDHVPIPEFIDRVLPYFEKEEVGYVQSVQAYKNRKESLVALGACEQTYHFYGPMMMCMNEYGTTQAIGANCAFRRKALDSIGGHAAGLAEDMHTSMLLHSEGWKSVYIPEILTRGLVPSSLPAYYKQQIKWSRGTFDIFFKTLPRIFSKLTWRQRVHYISVPLYFFYGVIDFLNILIPVLSLILAEFPWHVDLVEFVRMSLPILVMTILIRQYAQKWLLETHERGFHFVGGLLKIGTWWVFALGFIYTLFNVKVPYIPTPKEGKPENSWKLSIPNITACLISIFAIVYGLNLDWSPYSVFMAGLASLNIFILGYVIFIGQQKTIISLYRFFTASSNGRRNIFLLRLFWWNLRQGVYFFLRKHSFYAGCLTIIFLLTFFYTDKKEFSYSYPKWSHKRQSSYYATTHHFDKNSVYSRKRNLLNVLSADFYFNGANSDSIPIPLEMNSDNQSYFFLQIHFSRKKEVSFIASILNEKYKNEVERISEKIRTFSTPVFVRLVYSDDSTQSLLSNYFKKVFQKNGVANVVWVSEGKDNFIESEQDDWKLFRIHKSDMLKSYNLHSKIKNNITDPYTSVLIDISPEHELAILPDLIKEIPQIRGIVRKCPTSIRFINKHYVEKNSEEKYNYRLLINKQDFFIKGVSYNQLGFLSDGHIPLTRSQLRKDFSKIKNMGANTVRRYHPSVYDRNIMETAVEFDLKILYGFWFDPDINYATDSIKKKEYLQLIERNVLKYKDSPSLLGWSLGNETTGLMEYYFYKPELIEVRKAYIEFIEQLSRRIKELDPLHPVFAMIPFNNNFTSVVRDFNSYAPSVDVIGINAHDKDELKNLKYIMDRFDPGRSYIISEFSAGSYWNESSEMISNGLVVEKNDHEKGSCYFWNWIKYVEFSKGAALGGIAYTWQDKREETATWFGITDYKGRKKPSYYALQKVWKDKTTKQRMPWIYIEGPSKVKRRENSVFNVIQEYDGDFKYEWFLETENALGMEGKMEEAGHDKKLFLELPDKGRKFRLYVFVSDGEDNVVTASFPLQVR